MRVAGVLVLLSSPRAARAWTSLSQAKFGVRPHDIAQDFRGEVDERTYSPQKALGYLWTLPDDPLSEHGLGGGISFAWDDALCDALPSRFRERYVFGRPLSCDALQAALHRAFATWSSHHKYIHFIDVTESCRQLGYPNGSCPLAEVFITSLQSPSENNNLTSSEAEHLALYGEEAATAVPTTQPTTIFRYTNGERTSSRAVIETYAAEIHVATHLCWYLDGSFCSGIHKLKRGASSPTSVYTALTALIFSLWAIALLFTLLVLRRQLSVPMDAMTPAQRIAKCLSGMCERGWTASATRGSPPLSDHGPPNV